jgi:hypothetical protein
MRLDNESRTSLFRVLSAMVAILISAFACVSYFAHSIAYSDVVGAPYGGAATASQLRKVSMALALAVLLQIIAVGAVAPLFASNSTRSIVAPVPETPSAVGVVLRYLVLFVFVATITVGIAGGIVSFIR